MRQDSFSLNERLTLYGLVKYPTMTDRAVAKAVGLKVSTVTAIKNRLKRAGYFTTMRVPSFNRLGCELLSFGFARFNPLLPEGHLARLSRQIVESFPNIVSCIGDRIHGMCIGIYRNYTEARETSDAVYRLMSEKGYLDNYALKFIYFPFASSIFVAYLNFAPTLHALLEIPIPDGPPAAPVRPAPTPLPRLSAVERRVFVALVEDPEGVDSRIAKRAGISRQTVTKTRKRLEVEGLVTCVRMPDLQRLGVEIMGLCHARFTPFANFAVRRASLEKLLKEVRSPLMISGSTEAVALVPAKDFCQAQRLVSFFLSLYGREGFLLGEPDIQMLEFNSFNFYRKPDFAPLLRKLLAPV